mmetsp:Transcript_70241/g.201269  ORF Transcript_70241/g.201269 Transcript_70241/m.201269 type:complete len:200 (+) Transcript_70241:541-1140(+)
MPIRCPTRSLEHPRAPRGAPSSPDRRGACGCPRATRGPQQTRAPRCIACQGHPLASQQAAPGRRPASERGTPPGQNSSTPSPRPCRRKVSSHKPRTSSASVADSGRGRRSGRCRRPRASSRRAAGRRARGGETPGPRRHCPRGRGAAAGARPWRIGSPRRSRGRRGSSPRACARSRSEGPAPPRRRDSCRSRDRVGPRS